MAGNGTWRPAVYASDRFTFFEDGGEMRRHRTNSMVILGTSPQSQRYYTQILTSLAHCLNTESML